LYFGAGPKVMIPVSAKDITYEKNTVTGAITTREDTPHAKTNIGAQVVAGIASGRVNFQLSYSVIGNITDDKFSHLNTSTISGGVGFRF